MEGVLTQFVVQSRDQETLLGHVVAYGPDFTSGYTYIGGLVDRQAVGTGFAIEAFEVFIDYLFATYPLRKIYLDVPEFNVPQIRRGIRRPAHRGGQASRPHPL